jgi:oxaloacetate decarboxylase gamma subunit
MESTLMNQGLELMLVGMGTVFVFLTSLVIAMSVMASVVARLAPAVVESVTDEEIAAITAAITAHREKHS